MKKLAYLIGIVAVTGGIAYGVYAMNQNTSFVAASSNSTNSRTTQSSKPKKSQSKPYQVTLLYDNFGFMPNQFRVPVGTVVTVKNISSSALNFEGLFNNPTPLNGLNIGNINPSASAQFVVNAVGSWQFEANGQSAVRGDVSGFKPGGKWSGLTQKELPSYNPKTKSLLINYTNFGFVPNMATVPVGTKVTILNSTNEGGMDFEELSSDSSLNPSLNLGIIGKGQSSSFSLTGPGTWHYVNTWETTDTGSITAQ